MSRGARIASRRNRVERDNSLLRSSQNILVFLRRGGIVCRLKMGRILPGGKGSAVRNGGTKYAGFYAAADPRRSAVGAALSAIETGARQTHAPHEGSAPMNRRRKVKSSGTAPKGRAARFLTFSFFSPQAASTMHL